MVKKLFFVCLCIFFFQIQSSNAQWEIVGEDFEGGHENQQLEIDGNGNTYLAYTTDNINNNGGKITVKKRDAITGNWAVVGNDDFSSGFASDLNLVIHNNVPYLAYKDGTEGKATVLKLDGANWVTLGSVDFTTGSARSLDMAIDNLGIPYIAFSDGANSGKTTVMKFDDLTSTWIVVGNIGFTVGQTAYNSLAIDSNNVVYVAYQMTGTDYSRRAFVSRFNGTSWEFVKTAHLDYASLETYTANLSLAIDSNNKLFLALSEGGGVGGENVVLSHDGTSWSYYGSNFGENTHQISLIIGNDDVLYEIYRDRDNSSTRVLYNDPLNPGWNFINPTLPNAVNAFSFAQQIAVDSNGNLFVAYQDSEFNKNKTSVYKFSKLPFANWTNISADTSTEFAFESVDGELVTALDSNNSPYVAYLNDGNKLTVAKFNGTKWNSIGVPNFEISEINASSELSFIIGKDNVPYIAFTHFVQGGGPPPLNKTKIKRVLNKVGAEPLPPSPAIKLLKFNGQDWVNVLASIDVGVGFSPILSLDNNKDVLITYLDYNLFLPIVNKINGDSLQPFETAGLSPGFIGGISVLIDTNNVTYMGFLNFDTEEYIVMKYNTALSSWELLAAGIPTATNFSPSSKIEILKIDSNNMLYYSHVIEDQPIGKQAVIKTYNNVTNSWDDFNVTGIPVNIESIGLEFDNTATPYAVYKASDEKVSVRKYNNVNSQWELLGASSFSFGEANKLYLKIDNNNVPYVIYTDVVKDNQPRVFSYLTNTSITSTATSLAWNDPTIWGDGTVPTIKSRVTIPAGKTVIIDDVTSAVAGSITIEGVLEFNSSSTSSSSLITQTDPIGTIAFKRNILGDKKWHIVAAPLAQNKDVFATNNALATGQGSNRGIGFYNDGNAGWTYYQDGSTNSNDFNFGDAYSVLLSDTSELQLEGSATASSVNKVLTKNVSGWNLVGNPYLAFLPINITGNSTNNILDNNATVFETGFKSLYLWNNATNDYTVVNQATTATTFVSPGQGFFVNAKNNGAIFKIDPTMRSHETATFFKSSNNPFEIKLEAKAGATIKRSEVKYFKNTTTGLDEGFDAGQFTGGLSTTSSIRLFTKLVTDTSNLNIDLALQVLPNSDYEKMVVPIGLVVKSTTEVTLNAVISELPTGYKVFLEDRKNSKFYRLDTATEGYTTEVASSDKKERFYLHTTTKDLTKTLGVVDNNALNTSVFITDGNILKVNGLTSKNTKLKIFNLLGKQVLSEKLQDTKASIDVNQFAKGFYIIKLNSTEQNEIIKKIIIK